MPGIDNIKEKVYSLDELKKKVKDWKRNQQTIVFTNGVFDILHQGHIFSLAAAAAEGDRLIVAVNADNSVRQLKGNNRPVNPQAARALVLAALSMVDAVILFEEETPLQIITDLLPDVLVKGGDYTIDQIAGAKEVIANGGKVVINPILQGFSTSSIIHAIRQK